MEERGRRVYEVVRLVRPMTLSSGRVVEADLRDLGLTVGMRGVLEVLADHGPMAVPSLARVFDVSRQATQRLVNELESAGLVRLGVNPRHRRSSLVELTAAGSRTFAAYRTRELEQLATLAPSVTDDELEVARRAMSALAADIRRRAEER